ncbi:hypothetical protein [Mycobacteroides salmoniphilum]|uniref:hypothetical protein n=1 Tax=Mycobacteroides salmoniphilum TaxID=404941 RepID=UPI0009935DC6|nr:hypothetical protein [Mycobacteroides salmoniphilum]
MDALLAGAGCHDRAEIERAYVASGGRVAVDHPAENRLLELCWPSVLSLAARIFQAGEVDHGAVLESLGLTRDTAAMGLSMILSGETPRIRVPLQRF